MVREEILERLKFHVPQNKKKRVIIHSDIAAEADDQFAVVHHLLTPTEDVKGIIAANFEWRYRTVSSLQEFKGSSMSESYEEGMRMLKLMHIDDIPIWKGAVDRILDIDHLPESEGADAIVKEAMKNDESPLYIALQGNLTDMAIAYLKEPGIADKITAAIWIGGGPYPDGGIESNMRQDVLASKVVFESPIVLWQIPSNVYSNIYLTFAELILKVKSCGKLGEYLADNMFRLTKQVQTVLSPHGEIWSIGDQPTISVLLETEQGSKYHLEKVTLNDDMTYSSNPAGKEIRVYDSIDKRLTMDDFFAKLELCYGEKYGI